MFTRKLGWGLCVVSLALTAALYPHLPDPMPTHWDLFGRADGFVAKPLGPFLLPLAGLGVYALVRAIANRVGRTAAEPLALTLALFFFFLNGITMRAALGHDGDLGRMVVTASALMICVLGNWLGKVRRNRWVGIRTPWTLGDDEVWLLTHRLGGRLYVAGGLLCGVGALSGAPLVLVSVALLATLLAPAVYSFVVHRRLSA